jgi:osmotically inducible lipoprotein OsmB
MGPQPGFKHRRCSMKSIRIMTVAFIAIALGACSGMSRQEKNTAYGATAGGVAGAVITGGGVLGTAGGAAVGGLIGHELSKDEKKK